MTPAQTILKMIEEVGPTPSIYHAHDMKKYLDAVDEIDAQVCVLLGIVCQRETYGEPYTVRNANGTSRLIPKYTRSRDALKAIRPEGWAMDIGQTDLKKPDGSHHMMWLCGMDKRGCDSIEAWPFPTEELAELHAIVQAVEYERGKP